MKENEKTLKFKDLIPGEIYSSKGAIGKELLVFKSKSMNSFVYRILLNDEFQKDGVFGNSIQENLRHSTLQEKHWLNECIKANKYISYKEAMKTFVEEDKIYDITKLTPIPNEEQKEESLVGRYVQSIKKYNNNNPVGSYDLIVKVDSSNIWLKKFLSASTIIGADHYFYDFFKLMPIGWSPEQEKLKEELPEYVEYIETQFKGQIVKIEDWTSHAYCKVIFSDGTKEQPFKHLVKESTKEDFDKQELLKEAKERYPNGSKVKSLTTNFEGTINWDKLDSFNFEPIIKLHEIYLGIVENNGNTRVCIYNKGEWAKIIEEPKKEIDMKKVEDLVYPDVIHLKSQKQLDKILKYNPRLYKSFKKYMLFGDKTMKTGYGSDNESYSNISYNIYEFSDIIFPEESIKDYDYEVVHCETQEQWDFACDKYGRSEMVKKDFKNRGYNTFLLERFQGWEKKEHFLSDSVYSKSLKIYTFSEWCKLNNYVMEEEEKWIPIEGDWVVSLENKGDYRKKGDVFQVLKVINKGQDIYYQKYVNGSTKTFRKALPHEIPNNQSNQTIDIGDEVRTPDGNGIVIGISGYDNYLVKGINNSDVHNGHPYSIILKKGNYSDQEDSYYYPISDIILVKKANSCKSISYTGPNIDISRELGIVSIDTGVSSITNNILQVKVRNKQIVPTETKQRVRVQLKLINKLNLTHYGN